MFAEQKLRNAALLLAAISLMALCLVSCDSSSTEPHHNYNDQIATMEINKTFDAAGVEHLDLSNLNGAVTVLGKTGGTTIRMKAIKEVKSWSKRDAEQWLDHVRVEDELLGNHLRIFTQLPQQTEGREVSVYFTLEIPENIKADLSQQNGKILVYGLFDELEISATNCETILDSVSNKTAVTIINGMVTLQNVSGDLQIGVLNGGIQGDYRPGANGQCSITALNGAISLQIPKNSDLMFLAKLQNGVIRLQNLDLQNQRTGEKEVSGMLGNGVGNIVLETLNGNISVTGF